MNENAYILDILDGLGLAINEKNNSEIIINYPIKFDKKSMKFDINFNYTVSSQLFGTFLSDFLNTDFSQYDDFLAFFIKYSLTLLGYNNLKKVFKNESCSEEKFKEFILSLQNKHKKSYLKYQEQVDMILDYCLLNPSKRAINFTPIQRLYVLRRISPNLTILNDNKSSYYTTTLFSSKPGNTEKEIYDFLSNTNNEVIEYDLIIPYNIESILNKSLYAILKGSVYLKVCKNCRRYFITSNKICNYCDNIAPNQTKKTCKNIGRKNVFENSKESDPVLNLYYKVYNRKNMMKSRNKDIIKYTNDFDNFSRIGKKKLNRYKKGELPAEAFKKWIENNI